MWTLQGIAHRLTVVSRILGVKPRTWHFIPQLIQYLEQPCELGVVISPFYKGENWHQEPLGKETLCYVTGQLGLCSKTVWTQTKQHEEQTKDITNTEQGAATEPFKATHPVGKLCLL